MITAADKQRFHIALRRFIRATRELDLAWVGVHREAASAADHHAGWEGYPAGWESFDEETQKIIEWGRTQGVVP